MAKDPERSFEKWAAKRQSYQMAMNAAESIHQSLSPSQKQFVRNNSLLFHGLSIAAAMAIDHLGKDSAGAKHLSYEPRHSLRQSSDEQRKIEELRSNFGYS